MESQSVPGDPRGGAGGTEDGWRADRRDAHASTIALTHTYVQFQPDLHCARVVLLERVLRNPDLISPVFQPIFDLERGSICGYETPARFKLATWHSPLDWLDAAAERGLQEPFEAALLEAVLRGRASLPENCFLTVNVSPATLTSNAVQAVIERAGSLQAIVIELTEPEPIADYVTERT